MGFRAPQEHENRPNRWSVGCTSRSASPLSAHFRGRHQRVRLFTLLPSTEVPDRSRTLGVARSLVNTEPSLSAQKVARCFGQPRRCVTACPGLGVLLSNSIQASYTCRQSAPFERPVAVGRWPEDSRKRGWMVTGTSRRHPTMKDPMQSDRAHVCAQASGIDRHHGPGGLAEVALVARREEVVLRGGSSSSERHDVVDVQDDAGSAARATAVATAKTIALENAEAHLRANGIASSPRPAACRRPVAVRRGVGVRPVPPLARCRRRGGSGDAFPSSPQTRRTSTRIRAPVAGRVRGLNPSQAGCLRFACLRRGSHGGTPSNGCTDREEPTPGEF